MGRDARPARRPCRFFYTAAQPRQCTIGAFREYTETGSTACRAYFASRGILISNRKRQTPVRIHTPATISQGEYSTRADSSSVFKIKLFQSFFAKVEMLNRWHFSIPAFQLFRYKRSGSGSQSGGI